MDLLQRGVTPRDILTRQAFENAIAGVAASGGSTNAVLHLLAMAREAGVPLTIDDFDAISRRTPLLADLKPGGRYVAVDLDRAGGVPLLAQRLVSAGLVDGKQMTPSGRTLGEEASMAVETPGQEVVRPLSNPIKPNWRPGHPQREHRARGMRGQDFRSRAAVPSRAGARLRPRGRRYECAVTHSEIQVRRRRGHSLRRSTRWARACARCWE